MSHQEEALFLDEVDRLADAVKGRLRAALEAEGVGLAPMEARTLAWLQRHPGCSQADFGKQSGRDKAQVARLVKPLVERGLVATLPDAADRRVTRLWLTEAGAALHQRATRQRSRLARALVAGIEPRERARALALLERLRANLEAGYTG
ncbi:MAG: MarR family winged helix-turn-helix transcriptional regulator [Telluria sp.]